MKRRHALLGLSAVLVLALVVPALGGPSNPIAEKALSLSKVNKTAKRAQNTANSAQSAAGNALGVANGKQDKIRWALVSSVGTIAAQSGGISVAAAGGGFFTLDFGASQLNHGLVVNPLVGATVGATTQAAVAICGVGNPGGQTCAGGSNDANHVLVETANAAGTDTARGFWITSIP